MSGHKIIAGLKQAVEFARTGRRETAVTRNSLGEVVLPLDVRALTAARVKLSDRRRYLDALEHIAGREALIISVIDAYLRAVSPAHVEHLIPALRAMARSASANGETARCAGCDGHECDNGCAYPGTQRTP